MCRVLSSHYAWVGGSRTKGRISDRRAGESYGRASRMLLCEQPRRTGKAWLVAERVCAIIATSGFHNTTDALARGVNMPRSCWWA